MMKKLVIFSAPSGAGKTTIVKEILQGDFKLEFSISATSRAPRGQEVHGKDYYFLSADEFREKIEAGAFVEWEEVYANHFYGTLKSEVERIWNKQHSVVFDVDVVGGLNIKKMYGNQALAIFIMPPSVDELRKRLEGRGTDSAENIEKRLAKALDEIAYAPQFDKIVVNDILPDAIAETIDAVRNFLQ